MASCRVLAEGHMKLWSRQSAYSDFRCVDNRKRYWLLYFVLTHFWNGKKETEDVSLNSITKPEWNAEIVDHQTTPNTRAFLFQLREILAFPVFLCNETSLSHSFFLSSLKNSRCHFGRSLISFSHVARDRCHDSRLLGHTDLCCPVFSTLQPHSGNLSECWRELRVESLV